LAHDAGLSWPLSLSLVPISAFFVACLAAFDRSRGGARLTAR
jgi:hypothetical protein